MNNINKNSKPVSFRMLFLLAAIIFFLFGLIIPEVKVLFYTGIVMFFLWIIGNIIVLILELDR